MGEQVRIAFPIRDLATEFLQAVRARDKIEVRETRQRDDLGEHLFAIEHGGERPGDSEAVSRVQPLRHLRLRIKIEQQHSKPAQTQTRGDVHGDGALAATALGIDDGDYAHG